jgi:hypothetical protein
MKQLILFALLFPLLVTAQEKNYRFQNDTLYTSCGFKIYEGQTLHLGKTNEWIGFKYIVLQNGVKFTSVQNTDVIVKELSNYNAPKKGDATIHIKASIVYKDGSKGAVNFRLTFEQAIGSRLPGTISELIVPEPFRISKEQAIAMHKPVFSEDTLYASCGYKIYLRQLLQFGEATGNGGRFRYVNIITPITHHSLENNQVIVEDMKDFGFSVLGNAYITIIGTLVIKGEERGDIEMRLAFDHAIENIAGIPSEIIVPDEFRNVLKADPQTEVDRLEALYRNGTITKAEFEALEKKLLQ